jgi:C-terminal processing protease CtpA/Prc
MRYKSRNASGWISLAGGMLAGILTSGCVTQQSINADVAQISIKNYETAKRNQLLPEQCQYARVASRAFLQAQDDENMLKWKAIADSPTPRIGANFAPVPADIQQKLGIAKGAIITAVSSGSPAADANLTVGDIVLSINGREITQLRLLPEIVREACRKSEPVVLSLIRADAAKREVTVAACK